ncbi:sulfatase-like hydrolase/transferase [Paenarthrobacter sp. PH39-S1]|uniref:sulfatase family protein n=1 Tax=Paenarthrobacter sp. PH39-S1 TaxID=3046204 RepID=UPI0024B9C8DE|nr:sulfatase-like hydrolase/transferase [Paenarthrobacter sp. PH39-S1]MDJ0354581.1 sulfatase-like hydrolase/transferase [Paenarthrobacter sp. PH39-S1]
MPEDLPNIVLIMADQFAAHVLGKEAGEHEHFSTPALDRLAADSTRYTRAYTSFPLCVPARSSMLTAKYPHRLGIDGNGREFPPDADRNEDEPGRGPHSLGHWFGGHGFDCAYAGKWHARQASAQASDGFAPIHDFGDEGLVRSCTQWLATRRSSKPFLLVASFDDPHTICEHARLQPLPYGDVAASPLDDCPPLPENFPRAPFAAQAPQEEYAAAAAKYGTTAYTAEDWRRYRDVYARLVSRVDERINTLLSAVDSEPGNTIVVFISDHGDGDSSHGWNQKSALFEECIRVPFLLRVPDRPAGRIDTPVAAVLGLLPTLCETAGIAAPPGLDGSSVLDPDARPVFIETKFDGGSEPATTGRAVIHGRYKYAVYNWGKWREQLFDLEADPGERRNLAVEGRFDDVLERMRSLLLHWCLETVDTAFLKRLVRPPDASEELRRQIFEVPY